MSGPAGAQAVKAMADAKYGNHDCATYRDMFELLARPDIDAVLIATGDHWHAVGSILAHQGRQARLQREALRADDRPCARPWTKRCGATGGCFRPARSGGPSRTSRRPCSWPTAASSASSRPCTPRATNPRSATIGCRPSPSRPRTWSTGTAGWGRRPGGRTTRLTSTADGGAFFDFDSGATLLDWGAHTVDLCQWANQADNTMPVEYEPTATCLTARYANGVRLVMDFLPNPFGDRAPAISHQPGHLPGPLRGRRRLGRDGRLGRDRGLAGIAPRRVDRHAAGRRALGHARTCGTSSIASSRAGCRMPTRA